MVNQFYLIVTSNISISNLLRLFLSILYSIKTKFCSINFWLWVQSYLIPQSFCTVFNTLYNFSVWNQFQLNDNELNLKSEVLSISIENTCFGFISNILRLNCNPLENSSLIRLILWNGILILKALRLNFKTMLRHLQSK